jgi:uncharacterized cupin superfamily protein
MDAGLAAKRLQMCQGKYTSKLLEVAGFFASLRMTIGYGCRCDWNTVDMRKVNLKDVPEQERKSPKGKFGRITKNISVALGREPESLDLSKRHPFDLALVRIPKGKSLCPYHAHAAESELYLVVSGRGNVREKDGMTEVGPGDAFLFQPGEAHQLSNAGNEDFVYYVIADNPRSGGGAGDSCYYPDSGKWAVAIEGSKELIVKGTDADYFDGEE